MSTTMRISFTTAARATAHRAARTAAIGLGGLALALGAAACTGGDDEPDSAPVAPESTQAEQTTEPTEEPTSQEPTEESTASDGGGDAVVSEEELTVAKERFVSFMQVVDDADYEAACGYVLDSTTGAPLAGAALDDCAAGLEQEIGSTGNVEPGTFDALDASMVEASADDSGVVTISFGGSDFPVPMTEHTDGQWYFTDPNLGG